MLPGDVSDWPPDFQGEMFRAKKHTGRIAYQTKMIPESQVPDLAQEIRLNLLQGGIDWANGFFFTHTVRGVKHSTQHCCDPEAAELSLEYLLYMVSLSPAAIEQGEWWVDVGLELLNEDEKCLQWGTSSHSSIVRHVLEISQSDATRITTLGSSKYSRDIASHLMAVSGCRIVPGTQARGPYEAAYFQMYTTDKAITYNPEGRHHGKALTLAEAMGDTQPVPFIEGLDALFRSARTKNASNARVEVRVPYEHASSILINPDMDIFRTSLLAFTRSDWW